MKSLDFCGARLGDVRKVKKSKETTCVYPAPSLKTAPPTGRAALPGGAQEAPHPDRNAALLVRSES